MQTLDLTGRIDAIRLAIAERLERETTMPPEAEEALSHLLHILTEAADIAEEGDL